MPDIPGPPTSLVKVRRAAQITLPLAIREAARLEEVDYLEAESTEAGAIPLRPVGIAGRDPPEQDRLLGL